MNRRLRLLVAMLVLFAGVDLCATRSEHLATRSSFGTVSFGHGALFSLLEELELTRGRSLSPASRLAPGGTIWWIEPDGVCDARIASRGGVDILDPEAVRWPVAPWIEAGGTAVVLLEPPGPGRVACDAVAGIPLPARVPADSRQLTGELNPSSRVLALETLHAFEVPLDWQVAVRAGEQPYVLERRMGKGRLVVIADAGFAQNAWLDLADSAPFAVDLVRAYGVPRIDELEHGFAADSGGIVAYMLASAAAPVFAGLALLGLLVAWRGNALPARVVVDPDASAPTLEHFVASMAALYERTGDHARVLERYRELCAARLRRHFGLPRISISALAARIEGEGASAQALLHPAVVSNSNELRAVARRLDQLVEEVMR